MTAETPAAQPDFMLAGRAARCTYYGRPTSPRGSYGGGNECNYGHRDEAVCTCEQPSSTGLPFFEFRGPGSRDATQTCKHCGYDEVAHTGNHECRHFESRGPVEFDCFYCGCHGWD